MPRNADDLTPKQERFCNEYLLDLDATKAVIRSGYSPNGAGVQGHQLLNNPKCAAFIAKLQARLGKKLEITQERVLLEYPKLGFSNLGDFMRVQPDGTAYFDLSNLSREQSATILEYQV